MLNIKTQKEKLKSIHERLVILCEKKGTSKERDDIQKNEFFEMVGSFPDEFPDDERGRAMKSLTDEMLGFWEDFIARWKKLSGDYMILAKALELGKIDRAEFDRLLDEMPVEDILR